MARAAKNDKTLKIGLVGIGGRGSGAAAQAMNADDNVALTAIGDLFEDRIALRSRILKARGRSKYQVTPETTFTGFDAYKKAIELGAKDEGEPGNRMPTFYGAYFRDPDGNKICVCKLG